MRKYWVKLSYKNGSVVCVRACMYVCLCACICVCVFISLSVLVSKVYLKGQSEKLHFDE